MATRASKIAKYVYEKDHCYHTDQHLELSRGLEELRNDSIFCDITILVNERHFPAHKVVLAAASKYFNAMFTSGFREACRDTVTIHGIPQVFELLLQFIYTGKLIMNPNIAHQLLEMACYLQLDVASQACAEYLIKCFRNKNITFEDALSISLVVECLPDCLELREWCHHCIAENFTKIQHLSEDCFYLVTVDMMRRMLDRNDLPTCEKQVLRTVLAWLKHDLENRKIQATDLLRKVRMDLIPEHKLFDIIVEDLPELLSIQECYKMLEKVFAEQDVDLEHLCTPRTTITTFIIPDNHTYATYYLDNQLPGNRPQWKKLSHFAPMPVKKLYHCNTLVVGEQLYLSGGVSYREPESDDSSDDEAIDVPSSICQSGVYRYTAKDNQWQRLQDMKTPRCQFPLVHHDGYLYAIGGESDIGLIKDVERYSLDGKDWERLAPLAQDAVMGNASSAVSFRGKILVYAAESRSMNGRTRSVTHSLQVFDPDTGAWCLLLTEDHTQGSVPSALVVLNDKCYRVIYGNCKCKSEEFGCPWHKVQVHEVLLDDATEAITAMIGEALDQSAIPTDQDVGAFCIRDDVFVTVNGVVHKTDVKLNKGQRHVNLDKWRWSSTIGSENCVVRLTFDKALLE